MDDHIWWSESGRVEPGTPFPEPEPEPEQICEVWHIEREKGYYNVMGEKVEKGARVFTRFTDKMSMPASNPIPKSATSISINYLRKTSKGFFQSLPGQS